MKSHGRIQTAIALGTLMRRIVLGDPATIAEIAEETGFHEQTVYRYVSNWREMKTPSGARLVRIAEWVRTASIYAPRYEFNVEELKDAQRPKGMPPAVRSAKYRERQRMKRALLIPMKEAA